MANKIDIWREIMKFCWCTIAVKDMEESITFYKDIIKLNVKSRFNAGQGKEICFLGDGETQIELVYDTNNQEVVTAEGISLGFEIESVEEMIKFLKSTEIKLDKGPFQPNPQIRFFFIKDPNGISIQFVEKTT